MADSMVGILLYIIAVYVSRNFTPGDSVYMWGANLETLQYNLSRPRTYLSLLLTGGIPLLLTILTFIKLIKNKVSIDLNTKLLIVGFIFTILLVIYSMLAAYTDGRFIWIGYTFMIGLGLEYLRMRELNKTQEI